MLKLKKLFRSSLYRALSIFPRRMAQSLAAADAQITEFLEYAGFDPKDYEHRNALFAYCVGLPATKDCFVPFKARTFIRRQWAQLHLYTSARPPEAPKGLKVAPAPIVAAPSKE